MRRSLAVLASVVSILVPSFGRASAPIELVASIPFHHATDLDFAGHYAFVGSTDGYVPAVNGDHGDGGLWVVDIADPEHPSVAGRLPCWGYQNDVGVWRAIVVMGMHDSGNSPGCAPSNRGGLRIVDVSNPAAPKQLSFLTIAPVGVHTLTVVGDTGYVYANRGGLQTGASGQETAIVDIHDPRKPKIVGAFRPPNSLGCHDININAAATRAYCPGSNTTVIYDITDPLHPVVISQIFNPAIQFHHSAVPSPDGKMLVLTDEAIGAHACDGTGASVTGALWFYDISNEALPLLKGWVQPSGSIGVSEAGWCTAHNFNMLPDGHRLVTACYTGGTSVIDFSNPSLPKIESNIRLAGSSAWSSYYYDGYVYVGDSGRGLDILRVPA